MLQHFPTALLATVAVSPILRSPPLAPLTPRLLRCRPPCALPPSLSPLLALLALCSYAGVQMITAPISIVPDIIPLCGPMVGDLVGCVLCCFNCCLGCCCWTAIVGIIWVMYRPMIGIPLLCCCVVAGIPCLPPSTLPPIKPSIRPSPATSLLPGLPPLLSPSHLCSPRPATSSPPCYVFGL